MALNTVRGKLLREIGLLYKGLPKEQWSAFYRAQDLFDANQISENRYCRQPGAALVDAETYLCLLENSRKHQELIKIYHGKGERSVQEAANLVGLKLPELYKEDEE